MENEPKSVEQLSEAEVSGSPDSKDVVPSRRRLLRASLKATPVVIATLASRPSLACHCVAPSAWGSINAGKGVKDNMGGTDINGGDLGFKGSQTRLNTEFSYDTYWYSAFRGSASDVWSQVARLYFLTNAGKLLTNTYSFDTGAQEAYVRGEQTYYYQNKKGVLRVAASRGAVPSDDCRPNSTAMLSPALTVSGLLGNIGLKVYPVGSGVNPPGTLVSSVSFGASMTIALINAALGKIPSTCLLANGDNVLKVMVSGSYSPKGSGVSWGATEIIAYLHHNWMARQQ